MLPERFLVFKFLAHVLLAYCNTFIYTRTAPSGAVLYYELVKINRGFVAGALVAGWVAGLNVFFADVI